jgi:hypothetical protein
MRQVRTADTAKAHLFQSILDASAAGKITGIKLDTSAVVRAEAVDRQVVILNEVLRTAQREGRVNLVLETYDAHTDELIRAVQATHRSVTKRLWALGGR